MQNYIIGNRDYNVVLFGEKHGIEDNYQIYLEQIKLFNKRIIKDENINKLNVIFEYGFSCGIYVSEYIRGNEIFSIDEFIDSFSGTMFGSDTFKGFLKRLKEYNLSLD